MKVTQRRPMTPRLTNATMLVLAWAAGACASMHSVLLSTQVSYPCNHRSEKSIVFLALITFIFVLSFSLCVSSSTPSHIGETGGAFLSSYAIFLCLPGIWFGHRPGHTIHQHLRGTFSLCHLWGALFLSMHAALLSAV